MEGQAQTSANDNRMSTNEPECPQTKAKQAQAKAKQA